MQGTPEYQKVQESLATNEVKFQEHLSTIGERAKERAELETQTASKNRTLTLGAGIPGVAALSYGYEGFKDQ